MSCTYKNHDRLISRSLILAVFLMLVACRLLSAGVGENTQLNTQTGFPTTGEGKVVGPSGGKFTSQDGLLSLAIPAGALAKEVKINIEAVPADQWTGSLSDLDPTAIVYALEPSGLSFEQPVAFQMTINTEIGEDGSVVTPVAFVINEAGEGELVDLDVQLDSQSGVAVISGNIDHFSWLVGHDGGLAVGLEQISPKERRIGSPWEAGVLVRNVTKKKAGIEFSIAVNDIRFEGLGEVEVVGTSSHHGFNLNSGEERKLDLPIPRWQCGDEGEGSYRVVVRGNLGGNIISDLVQWRSENPNLWESILGSKEPIIYVVLAEAPVVCVLPQYEASTQSGQISITGRVSDVNKQFTLSGTFQGGSAELTFLPELVPLESNLSPGGSYFYSGGGSGATVSGDGSYTVAGTLGQPLTLTFSGHGCAEPGKCADTNGVILLTPINP